MTDLDYEQATTTSLDTEVDTFSVNPELLESPEGADEVIWYNNTFPKYLGYYNTIPEVKKPVDALALWTAGKGWTADNRVTTILEGITDKGNQNFQVVMESHVVMKKLNGDSYTQIIRDEDTGALLNLKLLNPQRILVVFGKNGMIKEYRQMDIKRQTVIHTIQPEDMLHSINEPIGDQIHGTSAIEVCKWVIDARNEAMSDWRRISHRSTIRVMYIDAEDTDKLTHVKTEYKTAIDKGELMIIPAKPGEAQFADLTLPPIDAFMQWIRYTEGAVYKALGVPEIILGGTQPYTEASSKVGYLTFDPSYSNEQLELEADLWNQVAIRVKFNRPAELGGTMKEDEQKNTGQTGFQPKEAEATMERE